MSTKNAWTTSAAALSLAFISQAAQAGTSTPQLYVITPLSPVTVGSTLNMQVMVNNIADLFAWQFSLSFDPTVLQALPATEGSFLATGGSTFFGGGTVNNSTGTLGFVFDTLLGASSGVTGSGVLAQVNFTVAGAGTTSLNFSDVVMLNTALGDITVQAVGSSVQAIPEPATYALWVAGVAGLLAWRRRQAA